MVTVNVWPRLGTTVTLASGYVITAAGAAALLTDEIARLLAGYKLLTFDPTYLNPNPSPIPSTGGGSGGLVAASTAILNALPGTQGAVCTLTAGGGGPFIWDAASTAPIDNALCCGNVLTPGRWLRQFTPGRVSVDWFGAKGDGTTDDAAAIQAAINTGTFVTFSDKDYRVGTPLTFPARKTFQGCGEKATTIRALSALPYVAIFQGDDCVVDGISFHGNGVCLDAVKLQGCNGSRFLGCNFQGTRRHGVQSGISNNNNVTFDKCNFRFVGTTLTAGTVTTTAGSRDVTFSVPVDLSVIETNAYFTVNTVAPEGRTVGFPFIVEYWNSATSAHCSFPAVTSGTSAYTLYSGNGINEIYAGVGGNDNNVWRIIHSYAVGCAKAGCQVDSLYGPQIDGFTVDASFIGVKIGVRAVGIAPQGTTILRGYFEGPVYDVFVEQSDGTVITDPLSSSGVPVTAPDSVGYQSVTLTHRGRVASEGRINELVNAGTVPATAEQVSETTVFVSSSGASNIVQMLPDNGIAANTKTFTRMFVYVTADLGGKTLTFKTTSGSTLINGVPGTTGLTVSGNYKRYTATWCENLNGWVVV